MSNRRVSHMFPELFPDFYAPIKDSSGGKFPLKNVYKAECGDLYVELAIAGYSKDDVELEQFKDTVKIKLKKNVRQPLESKFKVVEQQIKASDQEVVYKFPYANFTLTDVKMQNGILSFVVLVSEIEKPKTIKIS